MNKVFITLALVSLVFLIWQRDFLTPDTTAASSAGGRTVQRNKVTLADEMNTLRAVFVTVPNGETAKKIAHGLVSQKLAACVNIIPQLTSVYEWEGKINEDSELLLMIKTQSHLFDNLEKFVRENHPYTTPEVIALPIEQGSQPYLDWIRQVTMKKE